MIATPWQGRDERLAVRRLIALNVAMIVLTGTKFFEAIGRLARARFRFVVDFSFLSFFRVGI